MPFESSSMESSFPAPTNVLLDPHSLAVISSRLGSPFDVRSPHSTACHSLGSDLPLTYTRVRRAPPFPLITAAQHQRLHTLSAPVMAIQTMASKHDAVTLSPREFVLQTRAGINECH
jgi:hypothetical protein